MTKKKPDIYYVCELNFTAPDPRRPTVSMHELDFYAYVPAVAVQKYAMHTHRLSLRRNIKTGQFELYRYYPNNRTIVTMKTSEKGKPFSKITNKDIESVKQEGSAEEIVYSGGFAECLNVADNEDQKVWGDVFPNQPRMFHRPCKHTYPEKSTICEQDRERYSNAD